MVGCVPHRNSTSSNPFKSCRSVAWNAQGYPAVLTLQRFLSGAPRQGRAQTVRAAGFRARRRRLGIRYACTRSPRCGTRLPRRSPRDVENRLGNPAVFWPPTVPHKRSVLHDQRPDIQPFDVPLDHAGQTRMIRRTNSSEIPDAGGSHAICMDPPSLNAATRVTNSPFPFSSLYMRNSPRGTRIIL